MKPYYQSPSGGVTVYCGRWEDCVASGCVEVREVGLVHADPPYGIGRDAHRSGEARGRMGKARKWPTITGNDAPFDPAALLALDRPLVMWGANHYASKLPDTSAWIVWDKRMDSTPDQSSDAKVAWTNFGGAMRIFRHVWRGVARSSETSAEHLHPTQKPIALSTYVFQRARLRPGALVFVPFLGSGPDLPAARAMGLRVVACDVSEECCRVAVGARLGAVAQGREAEPIGPLFGGVAK